MNPNDSQPANDAEIPEELRSIYALLVQVAAASSQAVEVLVARAEEALKHPPKR